MQFQFEKYLSHDLPDYDHEWKMIFVKIVLTSIIFLVVLPSLLIKDGGHEIRNDNNGDILNDNEQTKSQKRQKKQKKGEEQVQVSSKKELTIDDTQTSLQPVNFILIIINLIFILILFRFIVLSPNNTTTARRVYIAPLLSSSECQMIINMASQAADRNVQKAQHSLQSSENIEDDEREKLQKMLTWPHGWKKDRHQYYPTIDLNVAVDFLKEDLEKIANLLNARLSPLLARIYGVSQDSIRADDMFVVRYDGEGQQALSPHTDHSHLSFNILLNDDFIGGGTRFYNRVEKTSYTANPKPGEVIINNSMVSHEGLPTTKGTRYILVGFMHLDVVNPFTGAKTNIPLHASYLSFPWLTMTLREGKESLHTGSDTRAGLKPSQQVGVLNSARGLTTALGDVFAPHGIVRLIDSSRVEQYISDLDEFHRKYGERTNKSTWFKGQMIHVDIFGRIIGEWSERKEMVEKIGEL